MQDRPLDAFLAAHQDTVLVEIVEAKGSTPREAGTFMLVSAEAIWGTIGGGQFEYMAIDNARALLAGQGRAMMDIPLGPEIGQCCGGRTRLGFAVVTPIVAASLTQRLRQEDDGRPAVFLFGCGHVGLALAKALAPLPFAVTVVETRAEALADLPPEIDRRLTPMPEAALDALAPGGAAVILTHDHALDFLIAERALARTDLAYVGMIGSKTKRATFSHWLARQRSELSEPLSAAPILSAARAAKSLPAGVAVQARQSAQVTATEQTTHSGPVTATAKAVQAAPAIAAAQIAQGAERAQAAGDAQRPPAAPSAATLGPATAAEDGSTQAMLSRLVLPIGGAAVKDKRPAVIAALVAAELLQVYAARENGFIAAPIPANGNVLPPVDPGEQ